MLRVLGDTDRLKEHGAERVHIEQALDAAVDEASRGHSSMQRSHDQVIPLLA
jgi:hypothetical protein